VVVTFLGQLTQAKEQLVEIVQEGALATIYVKSLALNADPAEIELSSEFDEDAANDDSAQ
jgi:segregation and condensation protein A